MKSALREYGVILTLIAISVTGYYLFTQNKEDILSYSLDILGTKLVNLMGDDASKLQVAQAFERFQERVANQEVSSDQIQFVAANVLNLTQTRSKISAEEAEILLSDLPVPLDGEQLSDAPSTSLPTSPADSPSALPTPSKPTTKQPFNTADLGKSLDTLIRLSEVVDGSDPATVNMIRFKSDKDGVHVVMDPELEKHVSKGTFAFITRELTDDKKVRWNATLREDVEKRNQWLQEQEKKLELVVVQDQKMSAENASRVKTYSKMRSLQSKGAMVRMDSTLFAKEIEVLVSGILAEVEASVRAGRPDSVVIRRQ